MVVTCAYSLPVSAPITVSWQTVRGAVCYQVFRDGSRPAPPPVPPSPTPGSPPDTSYIYTVAAAEASGTMEAKSAVVTASTSGSAPRCFTADNDAQVQAGRATPSGGFTYAPGSGQSAGLWNTFVTHPLRQTAPGYCIPVDGQC
ncbi:hypothetical protein PUR71_12615 [Streptomyces sp. SP17BM10]|uniref:hypothetical protein n=1 Tax=Streptomyces sp. SP17BM10 TaxID=3002530 RepID=UPI002E769997|nr:hypothetical protein [Streptomyces sp. SP17BM10]MEE1783744.1 hypothetical protein [Streptomyces sp. SP17BM10]